MATALIVLGFDITHAVLTLTNFKPSKVVVALALVDRRADPRALTAYSSLSQVANAMGVEISKLEVDVINIYNAVSMLRRAVGELATFPPVIVDVGDGMRILVLEVFLAYLFLPRDVRKHIRFILYLEGTNRNIELGFEELEVMLTRVKPLLSSIEIDVISAMEPGYEYSLGEIYRRVQSRGFNVTKQYVYKVLKRLMAKGLVMNTGRGRYVRRVEDVFSP